MVAARIQKDNQIDLQFESKRSSNKEAKHT